MPLRPFPESRSRKPTLQDPKPTAATPGSARGPQGLIPLGQARSVDKVHFAKMPASVAAKTLLDALYALQKNFAR